MPSNVNLQDVTGFVFDIAESAGQVIMADFNSVECAINPKDLNAGGIDVVTCADSAAEGSTIYSS